MTLINVLINARPHLEDRAFIRQEFEDLNLLDKLEVCRALCAVLI